MHRASGLLVLPAVVAAGLSVQGCGGSKKGGNSAPEIVSNSFTVEEGTRLVLTSEHLEAEDGDSDNAVIRFSLILLPEHGRLQLKTGDQNLESDWIDLGVGSVFTQADVAGGRVGYLHEDAGERVDSFSLRALDDSDPAALSDLTIVAITISNDVDNPPSLVVVTLVSGLESIDEGTITTPMKIADIEVSGDPDGGLPGLELEGEGAELLELNPEQTELYLRMGAVLDHEDMDRISVRVRVAANGAVYQVPEIRIANVDEPPGSIRINKADDLLEVTPREIALGLDRGQTKVADIEVLGDPDGGPRTLILTGPDAAAFDFNDAQTALLLRPGVLVDYETKSEFNLRVEVEGRPDIGSDVTLDVVDRPDTLGLFLTNSTIPLEIEDLDISCVFVERLRGLSPRVELVTVRDQDNNELLAPLFELSTCESAPLIPIPDTVDVGGLRLVSGVLETRPAALATNRKLILTMRIVDPLDQGLTADVDISVYIEKLQTGTLLSDLLVGEEDQADVLRGLSGNDVLRGLGGPDLLDGGVGEDQADYSMAEAGVTVDLTPLPDLEFVFATGAAQGDRLKSIESVLGSDHADRLAGTSESNTLVGGKGDDFLVGGAAGDVLDGGEGLDTTSYAASGSRVILDLNADLDSDRARNGDAEGDRLTGIENLIGSAFADELSGDGADNVLEGGAGGDRIVGGDGVDTASYANSTAAVSISLSDAPYENPDDENDPDNGFIVLGIPAGGDAQEDRLRGIENLVGTAHPDVLIGDAGDNVLEGGPGADQLMGGDGMDTASYANAAAPVIVDLVREVGGRGGDARGDTFAAIERLLGSPHDDLLIGDEGDNYFAGAAGDDTLSGGLGNDSLAGDLGDDTLSGGLQDDTLYGGEGQDDLAGGVGEDVLVGGVGADTMDGGSGVDTASYEQSGVGVRVDLMNILDGRNGAALAFGGHASGDLLRQIENLTGSDFADTLIGDANANVLQGGGDADVINGGDGLDTASYLGSESGVTVDLSQGTDVDGYVITAGGDADGDRVAHIEILIGSKFADTLIATADDNVLQGELGDDVLTGGAGEDQIDGGAGMDTVSYAGAAASVTIDLSQRPDITGAFEGFIILGQDAGAGAGDRLKGIESIIGSRFADRLAGDAGDNVMEGGAGADRLMAGSAGSDTVSYSGSDEGVTVSLAQPAETSGEDSGFIKLGAAAGGDASGDRLLGFENLLGSIYSDVLTGNVFDNILEGGVGSDYLNGHDGADVASYAGSDVGVTVDLSQPVHGAAGEDQGFIVLTASARGHAAGDRLQNIENLIGSRHADVLTGDSGDNVIAGGGGGDELNGGAGDADVASYLGSSVGVTLDLGLAGVPGAIITLTEEAGGDAVGDRLQNFEGLEGSPQNDYLRGDDTANVLRGGGGDDSLAAAGGRDRLEGGIGDDVLEGGGGRDYISGGAGQDALSYENSVEGVTIDLSDDVLEEGDGVQAEDVGFILLSANAGGDAAEDRIKGVENLVGSAAGDILIGDDENNVLEGLSGSDTLLGGGGNDTLITGLDDDLATVTDTLEGGAGDDSLIGSGGIDQFFYRGEVSGLGTDVIINFRSGQDRINLRALDASDDLAGNQIFLWIGTSGFSADATGEIRYQRDGADVIIQLSTNADSDAELSIRAIGVEELSANDFLGVTI